MDLDSLQSSTVHTAMQCRFFRDDDILKCPEQFCGLYVQRTYTNESNVAEDSTGLAELVCTVRRSPVFMYSLAHLCLGRHASC